MVVGGMHDKGGMRGKGTWQKGGVCGKRGTCMAKGIMCGIQQHMEIRSMSGRYTSYLNAFLF